MDAAQYGGIIAAITAGFGGLALAVRSRWRSGGAWGASPSRSTT
jgi:hypothetical protein